VPQPTTLPYAAYSDGIYFGTIEAGLDFAVIRDQHCDVTQMKRQNVCHLFTNILENALYMPTPIFTAGFAVCSSVHVGQLQLGNGSL
jgi:hypothetical protein